MLGGLLQHIYLAVCLGTAANVRGGMGNANFADAMGAASCEFSTFLAVSTLAGFTAVTGVILQAAGAKTLADGRAKMSSWNPDESSWPWSYWLGCTLAAATATIPPVIAVSAHQGFETDLHLAFAAGWVLAAATTLTFVLSAVYADVPGLPALTPTLSVIPSDDGPGAHVGLALSF